MSAPTLSIQLTEKQRRLFILVPVGLVFLWLGWTLAAQPALKKIKTLKMSISTAGERLDLIVEIQNLRRKQTEMEPLLATEEARHEILGKLTSLAKQSGFVLQSLTPNVEQGEPYGRLTFELKAQARFPSLVWFLSKVRELKPAVAVYRISITNTQTWRTVRSSTETKPQVDLILETFLE